jgi:ornithine carbamoyltransferase
MRSSQEVNPRHLWSVDSLSGRELRCLLAQAARLRDAGETAGAPLRGRNLALLCEGEPGEDVLALQQAATALGAQVARLRAGDTCPDGKTVDQATARLLGRLYDAIDCSGLPAGQLEFIAREAGVPVFNGLGGRDHPSRSLAELLGLLQGSVKALEALTLGYLGDPQSDCARRWWSLAATGGMALRQAESPDALAGTVDLLIDARSGHPRLTPAAAPEQREANRRLTLQAMLVTTMA